MSIVTTDLSIVITTCVCSVSNPNVNRRFSSSVFKNCKGRESFFWESNSPSAIWHCHGHGTTGSLIKSTIVWNWPFSFYIQYVHVHLECFLNVCSLRDFNDKNGLDFSNLKRNKNKTKWQSVIATEENLTRKQSVDKDGSIFICLFSHRIGHCFIQFALAYLLMSQTALCNRCNVVRPASPRSSIWPNLH